MIFEADSRFTRVSLKYVYIYTCAVDLKKPTYLFCIKEFQIMKYYLIKEFIKSCKLKHVRFSTTEAGIVAHLTHTYIPNINK